MGLNTSKLDTTKENPKEQQSIQIIQTNGQPVKQPLQSALTTEPKTENPNPNPNNNNKKKLYPKPGNKYLNKNAKNRNTVNGVNVSEETSEGSSSATVATGVSEVKNGSLGAAVANKGASGEASKGSSSAAVATGVSEVKNGSLGATGANNGLSGATGVKKGLSGVVGAINVSDESNPLPKEVITASSGETVVKSEEEIIKEGEQNGGFKNLTNESMRKMLKKNNMKVTKGGKYMNKKELKYQIKKLLNKLNKINSSLKNQKSKNKNNKNKNNKK